jgi:hypothetical protein
MQLGEDAVWGSRLRGGQFWLQPFVYRRVPQERTRREENRSVREALFFNAGEDFPRCNQKGDPSLRLKNGSP